MTNYSFIFMPSDRARPAPIVTAFPGDAQAEGYAMGLAANKCRPGECIALYRGDVVKTGLRPLDRFMGMACFKQVKLQPFAETQFVPTFTEK